MKEGDIIQHKKTGSIFRLITLPENSTDPDHRKYNLIKIRRVMLVEGNFLSLDEATIINSMEMYKLYRSPAWIEVVFRNITGFLISIPYRIRHFSHCDQCQFNTLEKTTYHHFISGFFYTTIYIVRNGYGLFLANFDDILDGILDQLVKSRWKLFWLFTWYSAYFFLLYKFIISLLKLFTHE